MQKGTFISQEVQGGQCQVQYTSPFNATAYISPYILPRTECDAECKKLNEIKRVHSLDELVRRSWYLKDIEEENKVQ